MRPAFSSKSGSRGKIQHRCCQGRMASSLSHRQMVVSLTAANRPERRTCEPSSARLHRDSGRPNLAGSSHAMALTRTTSSGGEDPGASGSWAVVETPQALLEEALAPHAYDFASCAEGLCDLVIGEAPVGQEDHLRAEDLEIRQRIFVGSTRQLCYLLPGKEDAEWALSRHHSPPAMQEDTTRAPTGPILIR